MSISRKIITLFVILLCALTTHGEQSYYFDSYSVQQGLSNSSVKSIYQDESGYMWFGTRDGLNRFDGNSFKVFRTDVYNDNTISNNDITCLLSDNNGYIWIGTFNGIIRLDPNTEKFDNFINTPDKATFPSGVVTDMFIDNQQMLWVSTKHGLYIIDTKTFDSKTLLGDVCVFSMNRYTAKRVLVHIKQKGIAKIDIDNHCVEYIDQSSLHNKNIIEMFTDNQGLTWLGSGADGLFTFDNKSNRLEHIPLLTPAGRRFDHEQIHCISQPDDSTLLIGGDNGMFIIDIYKRKCIGRIQHGDFLGAISHNKVMSLFKDRQGGIWVGTFIGGVNYFNPYRNRYDYIKIKASGHELIGMASSLVEANSQIWVGHDKGISLYDPQSGQSRYFDIQSAISADSPAKESKFIYKYDENTIWGYLLNGGLFSIDTKAKSAAKPIYIGTEPTAEIRSIVKDPQGELWIAEERLSTYNPSTGRYNTELKTNRDYITTSTLAQTTFADSKGNIWVGTRTQGLCLYRDGKFVRHFLASASQQQGLPANNISVIFEDSKQRLWVGTYGAGVCFLNPDKQTFTTLSDKQGLQNNLICGIVEDTASGDIWISTPIGVSKIQCSNNYNIVNYTHKTGFPLEEVSLNSFLRTSDGKFYVGGKNGIVSFDPSQLVTNPYKPNVVINSIHSVAQSNTKERVRLTTPNQLTDVVLQYSSSSFVINYSALNYLFPKQNEYAYKLEGFDKEWIYAGNHTEVTYSNLTEGKYLFHVKACNNDGVWSDNETTIKFTILPPFYRTTVAKILYFIVLCVLIYFIFRYFVNKRTYEYKLRIDQIEKQNIEENHQMRLRLFTNFSHELRTPLTLIIAPLSDMLKDLELSEKMRYSLKLMDKNANRLLMLVNQLMDFRRLENSALKLKVKSVNLAEFLDEIVILFNELALKKGIKLTLINRYDAEQCWFDPTQMEKVIFNLLSNAFKNTGSGGEITLTADSSAYGILISVSDTGCGISSKDMAQIFDPFFHVVHAESSPVYGSGIGLNLCKGIIELHGGQIWAESTQGKGSIFSFSIHTQLSCYQQSDLAPQEEALYTIDKSLEKHSLLEIPDADPLADQTQKPIVLIVEDEQDVRRYIKATLRHEYRILEAGDGESGFEIAAQQMPDLIISDVMMPVMNGIELCNKLKEDIRTGHIPVVLLTARTTTSQIQEGFEYGADDYVLKPFNSDILKSRVRALIDNRTRLRRLFSKNIMTLEPQKAEIESADNKFMRRVYEYIEKNIDNPELTIENFSSDLGMSRVQLFRKLRSLTDITPNKLITQIRMQTAVKLLKSNNYSVNEVAYMVGFSDPSYFSKSFKSLYNQSPSTYIKNMSDKRED